MITKFVEHLLFPTTVYQNEIPVNENEFTTMMEMDYERMPSDNGYMTRYKRILTLLPDTRKSIEKHINYYAYDVLGISHKHKFHITTSWVNRHKTGDKAHTHFHANSLISGCYYLKMPESGGDICFPKPTNHNNFLSDTSISIFGYLDFKSSVVVLLTTLLSISLSNSLTNYPIIYLSNSLINPLTI